MGSEMCIRDSCSRAGENTGGGLSAEPVFNAVRRIAYTVSVGAGGASVSANGRGNTGATSSFGPISAIGGGPGTEDKITNTGSGGSGGGCGGQGIATNSLGGTGIAGQGFNGGNRTGTNTNGSGGGGAGGAGGLPTAGIGVSSSITGSAVTRAAGGAGNNTTAGGTNTGTGGGGALSGASGAGGSGLVILRFPTAYGNPTIGVGLTSSTSTSGSDTIISITAGTDTVTWN